MKYTQNKKTVKTVRNKRLTIKKEQVNKWYVIVG